MIDMRRHNAKTALSVLLALALLFSPIASTRASSADSPSDWALEEVLKAREYGLIPAGMYHSFIDNITRLEFCMLVMALYTKITGEPEKTNLQSAFIDTTNLSIVNAFELGIVKGVGGGYFLPGTSITRQEIAVMLFNAINAIAATSGINILASSSSAQAFLDRDQTDEWAVEAINKLRSSDIMIGDGRNRFNPLDNTTKEMAFILVNRIYLIYSGLDAKKAFPAVYTGEILMRIKASFFNTDEYQVIGDVYEPYPILAIADLTRFLEGEAFVDNNGALYYIDKSESLSVSVAAGYSGGQYYPVYVLALAGSLQEKLYIVLHANQYKVYIDPEHIEPYFLKTFSDVLFPVPEDASVVFVGPDSANDWLNNRVGGNSQVASIATAASSAAQSAASLAQSAAQLAAQSTALSAVDGGYSASVPSGGAMQPNSTAAATATATTTVDVSQPDKSMTFSELYKDVQGQLDAYIWLVQLSRGKAMRFTALAF